MGGSDTRAWRNHREFAKVLRESAEEFRCMAEAIGEEHTRSSFLDLARSYDELAKAEEAAAALLTPR